jgi:hypothetical protein
VSTSQVDHEAGRSRGSFPYNDHPSTLQQRAQHALDASQRSLWRLRYRHPSIGPPPHLPIVVVLGMHRSGTSAAVGILEDLGFAVPGTPPREGAGDNERGTREPVELTRLNNDVLRVNGSSWRDPPASNPRYLRRHMRMRNRIIGMCSDRRCVLKDPRMLLMPDLWSDVSTIAIGVVRNPVDVVASLLRRGEPISHRQGLHLWKTYNRALLCYAQRHDCPIAFFDSPDFAGQMSRCIAHHGCAHASVTHFFDDSLVRSRTADWRAALADDDAVALYEELTSFAIPAALQVSPGFADARSKAVLQPSSDR